MAKENFDNLPKILKKIPRYVIEIGVFSDDSTRKSTATVGVTNAELLFIHENGSPLRHLYGYKVLEKTIDYANKNLLAQAMQKAILAYINTGKYSDLERPLKQLCVRMENYTRHMIMRTDILKMEHPNSPATIKRKGSDQPLFDTGQMVRSITCRLKRI